MKFLPGDTYIYDSVFGYHRLMIRSDSDRWVVVPSDEMGPVFDEDMVSVLGLPYDSRLDRAVFIRRAVDILPDVLLGYADNIQF